MSLDLIKENYLEIFQKLDEIDENEFILHPDEFNNSELQQIVNDWCTNIDIKKEAEELGHLNKNEIGGKKLVIEGNLELGNPHFRSELINIHLKGNLKFNWNNGFRINNCVIEGNTTLRELNLIDIKSSHFLGLFYKDGSSLEGIRGFNNLSNIKIFNSEINQPLYIKSNYMGESEFIETNFDSIILEDLKKINNPNTYFKLKFKNNSIKEINLLGIKDLQELYLNNLDKHNEQFKLTFKEVEIDDKGKLFIGNSGFISLSFINCIFFSQHIKLNNIKIIENLIINDVNFGKTSFNGVFLSKNCSKFIKLPVFNDCIFNNIEWGKIKFKKEDKELDMSNTDLEQRDIYRQLKFVMDRNNNYIDGNKFFVQEMQSYSNVLTWLNPVKWVLFLQFITSYFGNCFLLPIFWIILLAYVRTSYNLLDSFVYLGFDFNLFCEFINPFSRLSIDNLQWYDVIWKIMLGYLYYNLIVSFKRQIRR